MHQPVVPPSKITGKFHTKVDEELRTCLAKSSIQKIAHLLKKQIHAIRLRNQSSQLAPFVFDYMSGVKLESLENGSSRIWILDPPTPELFNIETLGDETILVSGKLVQEDYAYYSVKEPHQSGSFEIVNMHKLQSTKASSEYSAGDKILNKCMVRLATILQADACSERMVGNKLAFIFHGCNRDKVDMIKNMDAVYESPMSHLDKLYLPLYRDMGVTKSIIMIAILSALIISLIVVVLF